MSEFRDLRDIERGLKERGLIDEERIAQATDEMFAAIRAYELPELRRAQGLTQVQLAERIGVSQARISSIERGDLDRTLLGTLEAYINALGGTLRIVADIGERSLSIHEGLPASDTDEQTERDTHGNAA